jgi:hypothetical protein
MGPYTRRVVNKRLVEMKDDDEDSDKNENRKENAGKYRFGWSTKTLFRKLSAIVPKLSRERV